MHIRRMLFNTKKPRYLVAGLLLLSLLFAAKSLFAHHAADIHNATEKNVGNWYGSMATIPYTNPNLRTGLWVYHRTSTNHEVSGSSCFRFSEIGWYKDTAGVSGLIVWNSGCNRKQLNFTITAEQHTYSQQYFQKNNADWYSWKIDGNNIGSGQTNFSFSTNVTCGGEVAIGVEAMGNTKCGANKKLRKNTDGTYTFINWGSHSQYVDNVPYTNVNDAGDPNNSFFSTGNE